MNLLHLRYFKKVVETKNITQAAKELFISQPALSRAMKALEHELEVPLFYHSGRNIELTVYANTFYTYVVKTLQTLDEGLEKLQSINETFTSAIILYLEVASVSIPNLVKIFMKKQPDIQLTIMQHDLPEDTQQPVFYISSEPKPGLTNIPIFTEPVSLAIPKNHPLAKKASVELADIVKLPLLMLSKKNAFRRTIDEAMEGNNLELTIGSTTDDPATLRSLLRQNLGISFFPEISWSYEAADPFILKPIRDFPLKRTVYLSSTFTEENPLPKTIAATLKEFYLK